MFLTYSLIAVIALFMIFIVHRWLTRAESDNGSATSTENLAAEAVESCHEIVGSALAALARNDVTEVCRTQRTGAQRLNTLSRQGRLPASRAEDESTGIYIGHMIDSAACIAGSARNIATRPEYMLPISTHCELLTLSHMLDDITADEAAANNAARLERVTQGKDLVEQLIADRTEGMCYEDFRDESASYAWLVMLYHLHAFINAYQHVCKDSLSGKIEGAGTVPANNATLITKGLFLKISGS